MANPARIVSNLEAEVNTLAGSNMVGQMTYWLRAMGLTHQQSDALGLPDWKLAGCPWPFESQLMSEIILTAEAGRVPETTDLMMLTLCSSTGEISHDMEPARAASMGNIRRLCRAMRNLVRRGPEVVLTIQTASVRAWVHPPESLYILGDYEDQIQRQRPQVRLEDQLRRQLEIRSHLQMALERQMLESRQHWPQPWPMQPWPQEPQEQPPHLHHELRFQLHHQRQPQAQGWAGPAPAMIMPAGPDPLVADPLVADPLMGRFNFGELLPGPEAQGPGLAVPEGPDMAPPDFQMADMDEMDLGMPDAGLGMPGMDQQMPDIDDVWREIEFDFGLDAGPAPGPASPEAPNAAAASPPAFVAPPDVQMAGAELGLQHGPDAQAPAPAPPEAPLWDDADYPDFSPELMEGLRRLTEFNRIAD